MERVDGGSALTGRWVGNGYDAPAAVCGLEEAQWPS